MCFVHSRFGLPVILAAGILAAAAGAGCRRSSGSLENGDPQRTAPAGSPAPAADPTAPPPRPKIVALGDSLTAGLGLVESQSYPTRLQEKIDADGYEFDVVNAGVSGDTSAGGLRRLDWVLEGDVRVLIVALGANDGLRGLSVADMKQNLSTIIERAKARGVIVILAGMEAPPNYGDEYAQAFRQAFRQVALEQRVLFIPFLLKNVAGRSDLNQADAIHPNAQGAAMVADTVWGVLRPMLDQMTGAS
jgi:acyl-CoA thioesterase I